MTTPAKKLFEVALPLPEIIDASAYDKMPGRAASQGHPPLVGAAAARQDAGVPGRTGEQATPTANATRPTQAQTVLRVSEVEPATGWPGPPAGLRRNRPTPGSAAGAQVEVTLEIQAQMPGGASDNVVRIVTENARTLKFTAQGFEPE